MKRFEVKRELFGKEIIGTVTHLDDGISVLLVGGDKRHIGAVSLCEPQSAVQTIARYGHKEHLITEKWAEALAMRFGVCACVECGIHYDGVDRAEIEQVISVCNEILNCIFTGV